MLVVNLATCDMEEVLERGAFRCTASTLTERLGASVIGASVYEVQAGDKRGPYHYHHGVEEWMYVVSGAPVQRDPSGERTLAPGELVAFPAGPAGAHTLHGPGRVVIFSAGAYGWGEAFVTVYPDSDKIAAAPGVMFRRGDALESWREDASRRENATGRRLPGGQTWSAVRFELAPGDETAPYHYEWCRERWMLVLGGTPTLSHADGEELLDPGSIACFPQGPTGAHRLSNGSEDVARLVIFSAPADRPMSAFYPHQGTVLVQISDNEGFLFNEDDRIDDYWDGEPGAAP